MSSLQKYFTELLGGVTCFFISGIIAGYFSMHIHTVNVWFVMKAMVWGVCVVLCLGSLIYSIGRLGDTLRALKERL